MQRELGAFTHCADEQADADDRNEHPVGAGERKPAQLGGLAKHLGVIERASVGRDQANAEDETEVTHAIDQKGLHVGEDGRGLIEPEADQQIGNQAHRFPAKE